MAVVDAVWIALPYLPIVLFAKVLLQNLVLASRNRFSSDIDAISGPPLKRWWHLYTIGHNFLYEILFVDAVSTAEMFNSWRQTYGPDIFQIRSFFGARNVIIASESAIRTVTVTKNSCFVKPEVVRNSLGQLVGENGIVLAEGENHARLRRAVAPSMHHDALSKVGNVFLEQGAQLAERLREMGESGGDVLRDVRISAFAVILQACLGKNSIKPDVINRLQDAYLTVFLESPKYQLARVLLQEIFWFVHRRHFSYREDLKKYIRETVSQLCDEHKMKRADGKCVEPSLMSLMIDQESKTSISNQEMVETILSFLIAGQATTSLAVCWTLYLLAREQNWQRRLVQELDGWSSEGGLDALNQLPLLDRVVKESTRLYPPVCYTVRHTVKPVTVEGYKLPKDTFVRIPIMALQRNEEIWGPDASEFNPDRFLREGEIARTKFYMCLFAFGPRSCIGQRFAIYETKALVAQVLKRLRVFTRPLEDEAPRCQGSLTTPVGMKLYFETRSPLGNADFPNE